MRKLIGWIVFVLGVLGLTWWANGHQAEKIETKVTTSANEILDGLNKRAKRLTATTVGRDITVEGNVLKTDIDAFQDSLSNTSGRRVVHMNATQYDSFGQNYSAKFDAASGLTLDGFISKDKDDVQVSKQLGFEKFSGGLSQTALGQYGARAKQMKSLAPLLANDFETAELNVKGGSYNFTGTVGNHIDIKALSTKVSNILGKKSQVEITEFTAPDGTARTNIKTGENEVFTSGYWLPDFDFQATLEECQARTDDILKNYKVTFVTGGSELDAESREAINRVSGVLRHCLAKGELTLELAGHTDSDGNPQANLALSQARATAVVEAIKTRGISTEDVNAMGYGDTQPIASNDTAEGKQANRRTTITWATK